MCIIHGFWACLDSNYINSSYNTVTIWSPCTYVQACRDRAVFLK